MKAFVITRDRVSYVRECVHKLVMEGLDVIIVDHYSTHRTMLKYLDDIAPLNVEPRYISQFGASVTVLRRLNAHPRDLWTNNTIASFVEPGERFIVTDCDVIPDYICPRDWVKVLGRILDENPWAVKVGLGLRLDDLPVHYEHRDRVRSWESQWHNLAGPVVDGVPTYRASVDTTLAMYRTLETFELAPALRTGGCYLARHLPWYENSTVPTDEELYYRAHSTPGVSHWLDPKSYEVASDK